MRSKILKVKIYSAFLFTLLSVSATAEKLQILDQHQQPVANALVSISKPVSIFMPKIPAIVEHDAQHFTPKIQVISKGQSIRFIHNDHDNHQLLITDSTQSYHAQLTEDQKPPTLIFKQPGIVTLTCQEHSEAVGYVYVSYQESAMVSDQDGFVDMRFSGNSINVWHEKMTPRSMSLVNVELKNSESFRTAQIFIE